MFILINYNIKLKHSCRGPGCNISIFWQESCKCKHYWFSFLLAGWRPLNRSANFFVKNIHIHVFAAHFFLTRCGLQYKIIITVKNVYISVNVKTIATPVPTVLKVLSESAKSCKNQLESDAVLDNTAGGTHHLHREKSQAGKWIKYKEKKKTQSIWNFSAFHILFKTQPG